MAKNNKNITFRRIRGRIVPIRSGALSTNEKKGLKMAGLATVLGLGSGVAAGAAIQKGNVIQRASRFVGTQARHKRKVTAVNQLVLGQTLPQYEQTVKESLKLSEQARKMSKKAIALRKGGMGFAVAAGFATAALFQAGITPILDRRIKGTETEKNVKKGFLTHAAASGIAAGITVLGAKSVGARKAARLFKKFKK